jgi:hypothetical protein
LPSTEQHQSTIDTQATTIITINPTISPYRHLGDAHAEAYTLLRLELRIGDDGRGAI